MDRLDILENNKPESFMEFWNNKLHKRYFNEREEIIKNALKKAGFNIIDYNYLKENFILIRKEGDKFEHLYYHYGKDDEQRIISIEKEYNIEYSDNEGSYKVTMSQQYY